MDDAWSTNNDDDAAAKDIEAAKDLTDVGCYQGEVPVVDEPSAEERIAIVLPGRSKRKPPRRDGQDGQASFPTPPPGTGSRKLHQSTGALPPPRPTQGPAVPVGPAKQEEQTKPEEPPKTSWEQFGDGDSSSVSSDNDLETGQAENLKVDESEGLEPNLHESSRKSSATSIVKSVTNKTSKKIHDLLEPSEKKLAKKREKKERKRKRAEQSKEMFSKFIYDEDSGKPEVKSAALKEFDEMQARIASAVQEAEQNLQKTKETHQGSHKQHEAGDAWGVTSTKDDKTTWEGFDDNFSKVVVVEVAEVAPTEKSSIPVIKMFQTDEEEVDTGNPFAAASSNDIDLLGSIGVTSSAVSSYSLVNLGEMTSSTPNSVPGQFDTLVPLCCDGMTTSVSKDDVFGLTNQIAAQSGAAKIKIASNFDLFGLEDEVVTSEVKTNDTPLFTPAYGIDDATAADYDDPFVIRPVTDKIAQDDNVIKDAIDAAFGNPFEIPQVGNNAQFVATFDTPVTTTTTTRSNPFDMEPIVDANYANFNVQKLGPDEQAPESEEDEIEEEVAPFEPFEQLPEESEYYNIYLRQPPKKKRIKSQNRFWKEVCVRICVKDPLKPTVNIYKTSDDKEVMQSQVMQYSYTLCNLGLQQYDQYGKCHTVKLQSIQYKERVNVKADRIAPTLADLTKVRDFKGLKNLVHRPKATMILDHSPIATEVFKFGGRDIEQFKRFINRIENVLFKLAYPREIQTSHANYTKDDITVDIIDDYQLELNKQGHIIDHKVRTQVFCLAFLSGGKPRVELGLNHKRRQGKEVVGRKDIIPIKTDEWVRFHEPEFNDCVDVDAYHKTHVISMIPPDASHFEVMRFRVKPPQNRELPLQLQVRMNTQDKSVHIHAEILIPGYYSNSKRSPQHPCEDIQVRFPIPEEWIYMFRTEKRFRYGSVHSTTRKAGKIKGLERLTQMAQGILPGTILEVTTGTAKYEHVYHDVIWRINRLPERNHGAYKLHQFDMKLELGSHDVMPESYSPHAWVQYTRPNSMVSRAQIRSISISGDCGDGEVDKWVHHTARYSYRVDIDFEIPKVEPDSVLQLDEIPVIRDKPRLATFDSDSSGGGGEDKAEDTTFNGRKALSDTDSSDSSDDETD